jgi:hypothetical protein
MNDSDMTTFENAKIGERVFSPTFGWGKIERIGNDTKHPINVRFSYDNSASSFTLEGYYRRDLPIQSLFWDEVSIKAPVKPVPMKVINGLEIPDISFKPNIEERCYIPAIIPELYRGLCFYRSDMNVHLSDNGMCYPDTKEGKQAAILHAKAMLGIHIN